MLFTLLPSRNHTLIAASLSLALFIAELLLWLVTPRAFDLPILGQGLAERVWLALLPLLALGIEAIALQMVSRIGRGTRLVRRGSTLVIGATAALAHLLFVDRWISNAAFTTYDSLNQVVVRPDVLRLLNVLNEQWLVLTSMVIPVLLFGIFLNAGNSDEATGASQRERSQWWVLSPRTTWLLAGILTIFLCVVLRSLTPGVVLGAIIGFALQPPHPYEVDRYQARGGFPDHEAYRRAIGRHLAVGRFSRRLAFVTAFIAGAFLFPGVYGGWLAAGGAYVVATFIHALRSSSLPKGSSTGGALLSRRTVSAYVNRVPRIAAGVPPLVLIAVIAIAHHLISRSTALGITHNIDRALGYVVVAIAVVSLIELACAAIIHLPQPSADPDLVAVDDAFRSGSLHLLIRMSLLMSLVILSQGAYDVAGAVDPGQRIAAAAYDGTLLHRLQALRVSALGVSTVSTALALLLVIIMFKDDAWRVRRMVRR